MKRLLPLLLLFLFNSCFDQNDCVVTNTNLVKVDLKTIAGATRTASFITVQQDSIGDNRDGVLHLKAFENTDNPISSLTLPLNPTVTRTHYSFLTSDSLSYHLSLEYSTFTRVISTDCGAFLYYDNLSVAEGTTFPEVQVTTSKLLIGVTTNVKVFF